MKVIFNCYVPFSFAHGGAQVQIAQTMAGLNKVGVTAEPLRWWDDTQKGDIFHHFGRLNSGLLDLAHQKGLKVVLSELLTAQGSRSPSRLRLQRWANRTIETLFPGSFGQMFNWQSYRNADAVLVMTTWERHLVNYLFRAPLEKIFIVGNGVEEAFLQPVAGERGPWLICTATITPRKRVVELAEAAVRAQTPLWIVGKAYSESDPYAKQFYALVKQHPKLIRCDSPAFDDREGLAKIYRAARGFVLLSAMETRSLAAEEAVACECPLLLSDLPWARSTFNDKAQYCSLANSIEQTAAALRAFYDAAPGLPRATKPPTWTGIAEQLKGIYEGLLAHKSS